MSSWEMQLVETAKEELEILETQYPNRFTYLKSDLQSFIQDHSLRPTSPIVLTQESSNCKNNQRHKKRKYTMEKSRDQGSSSTSSSPSTGKINNMMAERVVKKRKDRVEMVLERAYLCLQKIRDVKASLC